jgi:hypothetical protein
MHIIIGCEHEQNSITDILIASIEASTFNLDVKFHRGYQLFEQLPAEFQQSLKKSRGAGGTVFSIQRLYGFIIFKEPCLYIDSDMIVTSDFKKLLDICCTFVDKGSVYVTEACPEYGVQSSLSYWPSNLYTEQERLDLSKDIIANFLSTGSIDRALTDVMKIRPNIPGSWNCREAEKIKQGDFDLAHFTDMGDQPWLRRRSKYGEIWHQLVIDLTSNGADLMPMIYSAVFKKEIGPWVGALHKSNVWMNITYIPKYTGRNSKLKIAKQLLRLIRNIRDEIFRS